MILEEAIKNFEQEIGEFEGLKKIKAVTHEDYEYIEKTRQFAEWLKELKERREKDTPDTNARDTISRQAAIDTEGLDAQIRCEMCRNPMHTDRGCDGNCKYDEKLYERIMQILDERIKPLSSVQPDVPNTNIGDMISRRAAIDTVTEYEKLLREILGDKNELAEAVKIVKHRIIALPSAQPEQRWIPCSERLPE